MKAKIIISALAILALLFISGCAKISSTPTQPTAKVLEECEKITNEFAKSKCYLYAAIRLQDEDYCQSKDAEYCFEQLALIKKEVSVCDKAAVRADGDRCYSVFAWEVSFNQEHCNKILNRGIKENCMEGVGTLGGCETPGETYIDYCHHRNAIVKRDPGVCNKILSNKLYRDACDADVHEFIARLNNDVLECDKISSPSDPPMSESYIRRALCIESVSVMRGDGGLLCTTTSENYQNGCFKNYALQHLDFVVCEKIAKRAGAIEQESIIARERNDCLNSVAIRTFDKEVCQKITNDLFRTVCLNAIKS